MLIFYSFVQVNNKSDGNCLFFRENFGKEQKCKKIVEGQMHFGRELERLTSWQISYI